MSSKLSALFRPFTRCCGTPSEPRARRAEGKAVDMGQAQADAKVADGKATEAKAEAKATGRVTDRADDTGLQEPRTNPRPRVADVAEGTTGANPPSNIPRASDNPFEPAAETPASEPSLPAAEPTTETPASKPSLPAAEPTGSVPAASASSAPADAAAIPSVSAREPSPEAPASGVAAEHVEDAVKVDYEATADEPFLGPEPGDSVAGVPTEAQPEPVTHSA